MASAQKRKVLLCPNSTGSMTARQSTPDLHSKIESIQEKRRRLSIAKAENESSSDSLSNSNYIPSNSEDSSDSEFEDHPYSRSAPHLKKRVDRSRPKSKSDINILISQLKTSSKEGRGSKCTSKNALMARLNRLKKKKYIEDLENKNADLEAENQILKNMLDMRAKEVESLKRKTLNLENVIRNKTEIGSLLKCVQRHTDLEISSSLLRSQPNNSPLPEVIVDTEKSSSRDLHELEAPPSEEEALVAAVLWGMALHTFCQPYKPRTSTS